ncbi:MAG TPA: HAD family phosphatase [Candidatus Saccharimonadales bacterium]|jgi:HAD superfamily hydrolase (TIGR01490 family)|nr:HAD family phosphatase [Candidatus Saccharimonadales bacterium]
MTKQKLAAFDIDGTLFRSGLYREVFYELYKMGALPPNLGEETTLKHREWRHRVHGNAFEEFEEIMVGGLNDYLPKLRISDYDEAAKRVLEKRAENIYVYTRNLLCRLQTEGYMTIAISGSQQELVEPFAKRYGFDAWVGQQWERGDEYFTGNVVKTHTDKDKILQRLIDEHNLTLHDSYAVGDSNGDVGMLGLVENPIAFNPTYELLEKAMENDWKIVIERKNTSFELTKEPNLGQYILEKTNHQ